jgi:hypothetical protein
LASTIGGGEKPAMKQEREIAAWSSLANSMVSPFSRRMPNTAASTTLSSMTFSAARVAGTAPTAEVTILDRLSAIRDRLLRPECASAENLPLAARHCTDRAQVSPIVRSGSGHPELETVRQTPLEPCRSRPIEPTSLLVDEGPRRSPLLMLPTTRLDAGGRYGLRP